MDVGLDYLSLSQSNGIPCPAGKHSVSVWQRRLVPDLLGVCYILDEPSIGLHQRDNDKLLAYVEKFKRSWQYADCGRT